MATWTSWFVIAGACSQFIDRVEITFLISGFGEYVLAEEFQNIYSLPRDEMCLIPTVSLDEIVKNVKEGAVQNAEPTEDENEFEIPPTCIDQLVPVYL